MEKKTITLLEKHKGMTQMDLEDLRAAFNFFDTDGSGDIDYDELFEVIKNLGFSTEHFNEFIKTVDTDKNRQIDFEEFVELMNRDICKYDTDVEMSQVFGWIVNMNKTMQKKKSTINIETLKALCKEINENIPEEEMQDMIRDMDRDNDGEITVQDFQIFFNAAKKSSQQQ